MDTLFDLPRRALSHIVAVYGDALLSINKSFTLITLTIALVIALAFLLLHRRRRIRPVRLKVLFRAVFPRKIIRSASTRADLGFYVLNTLLITSLFGGAVLSAHHISAYISLGLAHVFGAMHPTALGAFWITAISTIVLYVAVEFGYFLDHYLSHKIPFLWEFHKVHHSAEVLTPLTNFRVHPLDTLVFYNITAIVLGVVGGILHWSFGQPAAPFTIFNVNVLVLLWIYTLGELQHSHLWIAFTGTWGKFLISPAHHQIHHSMNPIHFDRNMGNSLAIFDWMFGTLFVPGKTPEKLAFGVDTITNDPNTISESLIMPVGAAFRHLLPKSATETGRAAPATS